MRISKFVTLICWIVQLLCISSVKATKHRRSALRHVRRGFRPPPVPVKKRDPEKSAIPESFFSTPRNCNPHNYTFTINEPKLCINRPDVYLLMLIRTIYSQSDRRQAIRQTWANQRNFPDHQVILVFLFGSPADKKDQRGIEEESRRFGDVVQENFVDSYQNLTLKDVMGFKWAWVYCPHAKFVLVGSDETIVDVFKLMPFLEYSASSTDIDQFNNRFTLCHLYPCCTKVYRQHVKYSADLRKYGGNAYPNYCSGTTYIVPSEAIRQLYSMSWDTPSFMPDDAWIGVLAEKLGLTFHDSYRTFTGIRNHPTVRRQFTADNYFESEVMIGVLDYDFPGQEAVMMKHMWQLILEHHKGKKVSGNFWRERDRRNYPPEPSDVQNEKEMHFAFGFALLLLVLDAAILCILFAICYLLKKKWFNFLCRRWVSTK